MPAELLNPDGLILSDAYEETMKTVVLPALDAHGKRSSVKGDQGRSLACRQVFSDQGRGTVMIVHGFTESAFKFSELSYSLWANGYSVCAYDQRGHGFSWRRREIEDRSLTHVDDFEEYVRDMERVVDELLKDMPKPWYIFAHSMGGAVASLYLERHDGVFQKAVLCAPMIAPNLGGMPAPLIRAICRGAKTLKRGQRRVFVSRPFSGPEDFTTSCATGRARFDWYDAVRVSTPEYQNNGPTYGWTLEAANCIRKLLAPGAPEAISIPVRLYTAEDDSSVMPKPQLSFIRRVKRGERKLVKGSRHEIYRSNDEVLFPWWHEILEFYAEA